MKTGHWLAVGILAVVGITFFFVRKNTKKDESKNDAEREKKDGSIYSYTPTQGRVSVSQTSSGSTVVTYASGKTTVVLSGVQTTIDLSDKNKINAMAIERLNMLNDLITRYKLNPPIGQAQAGAQSGIAMKKQDVETLCGFIGKKLVQNADGTYKIV